MKDFEFCFDVKKLDHLISIGKAAVKPHKGTIRNWTKHYYMEAHNRTYPENLGYIIEGTCTNHPAFGYNKWFRTSLVMTYDRATGEIETLNSRYTLDPPNDDDPKPVRKE